VAHDEVTVMRARAIAIRGPAGLEFMVDGEFRGATPARIECLPGTVELFVA
jgi:diacylglycerol kinase family enzyme